ncbi:hypothetical protein IFM61606_06564 [Aspergillus udagawae]|nr:hypothetical protein IFM61606_06564 [Aspergillus udagawae]
MGQKNQRDRLKAALEQMARVLHAGGVRSGPRGPSGTKLQVELIETAVEYIQSLEKEVKTLRSSVNEEPRSEEGVECFN